jgi:hypothetical protein
MVLDVVQGIRELAPQVPDLLALRAFTEWHIFCSTPAHKARLRAIIGP